MQALLEALLRRLDPAGADEVLDTHADLTAGNRSVRSQLELAAMVGRALRHRLGLAPGTVAGNIAETASPPAVILAAGSAAALLAGEAAPGNRTLWLGDAPLAGPFVTTGPVLFVAIVLLAAFIVAGTVRAARGLAHITLAIGALLISLGNALPWSRPPLFVMVPLLCAAAVTTLVPPGAAMRRGGIPGLALFTSAIALASATGAFAFRDRMCGVCMYRGLGPLELVGVALPPLLVIATVVATVAGVVRGRAFHFVAVTLVAVAPWMLISLRLVAFRSSQVMWHALLLGLLVAIPVALTGLLAVRRSGRLVLVFAIVAAGLLFRVGSNATSGPIPGQGLLLTPTLGTSCLERRGATDITWAETIVNPSQSLVVQSARVESASALTLREASFVPLRVTSGGFSLLGITLGFPPRPADLARAANPDWNHRLLAEGARLEPGTQYLLAFGLHLTAPDTAASLQRASMTFEAEGQRSSRTVSVDLRLPAEGVRCS